MTMQQSLDSTWSVRTGNAKWAVSAKAVVPVNYRWCDPAHFKERICASDGKLCAVGLHPYYLPKEFSHVVMVTVCASPFANPSMACDTVHSAIAWIQTPHSSAFIAISGDFNINLDKILPTSSLPPEEQQTCCMLMQPPVPTGQVWLQPDSLLPMLCVSCKAPARNFKDSQSGQPGRGASHTKEPENKNQWGQGQVQEETGVETSPKQHERGVEWHQDNHWLQARQ